MQETKLPEAYNVTIKIEAADSGITASFTAELPDVPRAVLLAPDYPSPGITAAVRAFEAIVFGDGEPPLLAGEPLPPVDRRAMEAR